MTEFVGIRGQMAGAVLFVVGLIGTLFLILMLLAVGENPGLSETEQANLASIDLTGYVVGTLIVLFAAPKLGWRTLAIAGLGLVILGNAAGPATDSFGSIATARFLVDTGSGICWALAMAVFAETRNPERAYGIALGVGMTCVMVTSLNLPAYLDGFGASAVYTVHAAIAVVVVLFIPLLPRELARSESVAEASPAWTFTWPLTIAMVAVLLFYVGESVIYSLSGVIGESTGMTHEQTGQVVGWAGQVPAILAAWFAAWLSTKAGRVLPNVIGLLLFAGGLAWLLHGTQSSFFWSMAITQAGYGFVAPYLALTCIEYDRAGRFAALIPTASLLGYAIGPGIAAPFIESAGLIRAVVLVGCVAVGLCIALSLPITRRLDMNDGVPHG